MPELSVMIEGALDLTWPIWKQVVDDTERLGFAGLFRSDHFTVPAEAYPDALELIISLTYLADHTRRIHFGPLVSPVSFRDPVMLAWQAMQLDDLSGGRMVLGLGAGWMEREHTMFGYELGDVPTRIARFEEGLEVISRLLRSEEPVSYAGRFFRLQDAALRPRPQRPGGPPIMIGGSGPRRILPLVARYADIWNALNVTPEELQERSGRLDELLRQAGRRPEDVKRTVMTAVLCARNQEELERRLRWYRRIIPDGADMPVDRLADAVRTRTKAIVGNPEECIEGLRAFQRLGVQEIMAQFFDVTDREGLEVLAQEVLPRISR